MRCRILAIFLLLCGIAGAVEPSVVRSREKAGDYTSAFELCKKAPDEAFSAYFIGDYLFHGRKGIVQNPISGRKSYLKAIPGLTVLAKEGNADVQYYLGRCYEYGKNDNISAREWYIKAADNGNSDAMIKAAMFIAKRRGGGKRNPQLVMEYIRKAIAAGNADGKALLASYYLEGRKDIKKGIQLSKEASDAGSPLGQMLMGGIYMIGMGNIEKDELKAIELFQSSSDQGNSLCLGMLFQLKKKQKVKREQINKSKLTGGAK